MRVLMKTVAIIMMTLALLTLFKAASWPVHCSEVPNIYVEEPAYTATSIGETFTVNISVSNAVNVNNWQLSIQWAPPSLLAVSDYGFGDFMRNAGIDTLQAFSNSSGETLGQVFAMEAAAFDEATGNGTLLQLTFTVLDSGCCPLHLKDTILMDADYKEIPHTTTDGSFAFTSYFVDYNRDGITDFSVDIETNSTYLADFRFNESKKQVSFFVKGEEGSVGYSNATIPKNLLDATESDDWLVFIDNNQTTFTLSANDTHTIIYLTYDHSLHTIQIRGNKAIPEYPSTITLVSILAGILLIVWAKKKKITRCERTSSALIFQRMLCSLLTLSPA